MSESFAERLERLKALGPDPLDALVTALKQGQEPPGEWVARWSEQGAEPVARAWVATRDVQPSLLLLALAGRHDDLDAAARAAGVLGPRDPAFPREGGLDAIEEACFFTFFGWGEDVHRRAADAIRAVVPIPPSLKELLSTLKR
jgi:hypothetical protein